jgi:hypothetical protein
MGRKYIWGGSEMPKLKIPIILVFCICCATAIHAATTPVMTNQSAIMVDTGTVFFSIVGGLFAIIAFFIARTLNSQTNINKDLYAKHGALRSDFDEMRGEHKANTCGGRRDYDPSTRPHSN